jgi:hypothetical protein
MLALELDGRPLDAAPARLLVEARQLGGKRGRLKPLPPHSSAKLRKLAFSLMAQDLASVAVAVNVAVAVSRRIRRSGWW